MVQLVECLLKFNLGASNCQVPHRYGTSIKFIICYIPSFFPEKFLKTQDIKTEINPVLNPRAAGPEGSLMGIPGTAKLMMF